MKIVLAFDSFKGCMTQFEACRVAKDAIISEHPDYDVVSVPMSDGGEGLSECLAHYYSAIPISIRVHGPLLDTVNCVYYISKDGNTAIMEMAAAAGLGLVPEDRRNPMLTTTYGVGEMIMDAYERGCRHIIMGIGGSATCDAGRGMIDSFNGQIPKNLDITVACDVTNPLFGKNGAAYVFGPQKGASTSQLKELDERLIAFANETIALGYAIPKDAEFPGAGAAGGLGYALKSYFDANLKPGVSLLMEIIRFEEMINGVDLIITGEGKSDSQTRMGKVPSVILSVGKKHEIPVILLSGSIDNNALLEEDGYTLVNSINNGDERPLSELMKKEIAVENLRRSILSVLNL